jgi:GNAT superfamily N-acetyltransferase
VIRRAGPGDTTALLPLVEEFCRVDHHPFDPEAVRRALDPLLESDELGVVWLIVDDGGRPGGYAVITWGYSLESGGRDALLDEFFVLERGGGRGGAALSEMLADCRRRGMARVFLETEAANAAVRRFYARHGFEVEDSVWMSLVL